MKHIVIDNTLKTPGPGSYEINREITSKKNYRRYVSTSIRFADNGNI